MQHHQPTLPPVASSGSGFGLPFSFGWPGPGPVRLQTKGTRHIAYSPTQDPDSQPSQSLSYFTSISALPAFQQPAGIVRSHEELRWEDWQAGIRSQAAAFPAPAILVSAPPSPSGGGACGPQFRRSVSAGPSASGASSTAAATAAAAAAVTAGASLPPLGEPFGARPAAPPAFGFVFGSSGAAGPSAPSAPSAANQLFAGPVTAAAAAGASSFSGWMWPSPPPQQQQQQESHAAPTAAVFGSNGGAGTRFVAYRKTLDWSFDQDPFVQPSFLVSICALPGYQFGAFVRSHEELRWEDRQAGVHSARDLAAAPLGASSAWPASSGTGAGAPAGAAAAGFGAHGFGGAPFGGSGPMLPPRPATADPTGPSSSPTFAFIVRNGGRSGGGSHGGRPPTAPRRHVTFFLGGCFSGPGTRPGSETAAAAPSAAAASTAVSTASQPLAGGAVAGGSAAAGGNTVSPHNHPLPLPRLPSFGNEWLPPTPPLTSAAAAGGGTPALCRLTDAFNCARGGGAEGTLSTTFSVTHDPDVGGFLFSISALPAFQPPPLGAVKSHEELRWEDRQARVRSQVSGPSPPPATASNLAMSHSASAMAGASGSAAAAGAAAAAAADGLEGQCCVCMERRAEYGFIHSSVMHLCLCGPCKEEMTRRSLPPLCPVCNGKALSVVKVVAT